MGNTNNQFSNGDGTGSGQPSAGQQQGGSQQTDIIIAKRSAIRQKLAIALMAVGGGLVAGLIWFSLYGQKTAK